MKYTTPLFAVLALGVAVAAVATTNNNAPAAAEKVAAEVVVAEQAQLPQVTVYKSASCGCCKHWVAHMREAGFPIEAINVDDQTQYKIKAKLGPGLGSCHTAFVDGYAIEGHVPASDIERLLRERPAVSGLAVPGMVTGSPGMESPTRPAQAYKVISFTDGKQTGVFSDYPAEH